jgi:cadmium resistance protein CadD (predicted permease)
VIVPLVLIVAMSWVVFWIDPRESGTQISVAITAMLTVMAYRFAVGTNLPKLEYMTRLDLFILGSSILVFVSLIQVVVTSSLAKSDRILKARKIDLWCRWLFPIVFVLIALETLMIRMVL